MKGDCSIIDNFSFRNESEKNQRMEEGRSYFENLKFKLVLCERKEKQNQNNIFGINDFEL